MSLLLKITLSDIALFVTLATLVSLTSATGREIPEGVYFVVGLLIFTSILLSLAWVLSLVWGV